MAAAPATVLTDAMLGDAWPTAGKPAALALLKAGGDDAAAAKAVLYECFKAATLEKIPPEALGELVEEGGCVAALGDFASALSDIFWMLHLVCDNQPDPGCGAQHAPPAESPPFFLCRLS